MDTVVALLDRWTEEARQLRDRYALETAARICEAHVRELGAAVRAAKNEILNIEQAAAESGYSPQHLRAMLAAGSIENAGRKGRPRIRRADLPRKAVAAGRGPKKAPSAAAGHSGKRRRGFDARRLVATG